MSQVFKIAEDASEELHPVVIPRGGHILSRRRIDPNALKVLYRLHNHGYKAYLVGGSVRDLLLRRKPKDFDIATDARPSQVKKLFTNCRIVGRRFRLAHILFRGGQVIEVSTFRRKAEFSQQDDSSKSPVIRSENTFGTPGEDAFRRDITINGLFYNIANFTLLDYVDGLKDLKAGVVRVIGDASVRLCEDPVRMIRVIRFAARTGFSIDPEALRIIREKHSHIRDCSPPRVREEFMRELRGGWSSKSFPVMIDTGLLFSLFPHYEKALSSPSRNQVRAHLLANLAGVDKIVAAGAMIPDQELIAAFVSPLSATLDIAQNLPSSKGAIGRINQNIRDRVKPIIRDFGASKGNAEAVCYMLFAQFMLKRSLGQGVVQKSLRKKNYFGAGLRLYQVEATGRREALPKMLVQAAEEENIGLYDSGRPDGQRRRRRPRRPKKKPRPVE